MNSKIAIPKRKVVEEGENTLRPLWESQLTVQALLMPTAAAAEGGVLLTNELHHYNHATDDECHRLRNLAEQAYSRRRELSQESQVAYKSGQKDKAHELSQEAEQELSKAESYNVQAAEYVFVQNNVDLASGEVDLHGLYVREAEWILKKRIFTAIEQGEPQLRVIVGKGLHSVDGICKIRPAAEKLCADAGLRNHVDHKNDGLLIIELQGSHVPQSWNAPEVEGYPATQVPKQSRTAYQQPQQPHQRHQQQHHQQQEENNGSLLAQILSFLCVVCK